MKKVLVASLLLVVFFSGQSQNIEIIKLSDLKAIIATPSDHVRIFNFWASWCGPCVKELPHFKEVDGIKKAEVILVSLDFVQDKDKPKALLTKKGIDLKSYLLNETDYDVVIPAVNPNWTGAIPASLIVKPDGSQLFYEKSFELKELKEIVNTNSK